MLVFCRVSRTMLAARYSLLPYYYTLFAQAHFNGGMSSIYLLVSELVIMLPLRPNNVAPLTLAVSSTLQALWFDPCCLSSPLTRTPGVWTRSSWSALV